MEVKLFFLADSPSLTVAFLSGNSKVVS